MVDKTLPDLDAVSTPVVTDILLTRQVADTEDRRMTRAQARQLLSGEQLDGTDANSGALLNVAASEIVPTLVPNKADLNTGVGSRADDEVSLIAGAVEGLRLVELNSGVVQAPAASLTITADSNQDQSNAFPLINSYNILTTVAGNNHAVRLPAIFAVNSVITVKNNGAFTARVFPASGDDLGAGVDAADLVSPGGIISFIATAADSTWTPTTSIPSELLATIVFGPAILDVTASDTIPNINSNSADPDSGIGNRSADELSGIAGGVEGWRITELNNGIIQIRAASLAITANAGGGQGGAFALVNSYNVITVSASTGDSVRLPAVFFPNSLVYIQNNGAEQAAVFPASGDDLGAGTNTSVNINAGESLTFIATATNATWTQILLSDIPNELLADTAAGPQIDDATATSTDPTLIPNRADVDTGVGWSVDDMLMLIAGAQAGLGLRELDNGVIQVPAADLAITAFATGGQGSATPLTQSYNVITVVATTADSVRLPAVFSVNSILFIKNDDAAQAADVFPASGDDLGAGVDTAVSIKPGESLSFIATAADSTWTQLVPNVPSELLAVNAAGPAILDEAASSTNPTLRPNQADPNTGVGWAAGDVMVFLAGGVDGLRLRGTGGTNVLVMYDTQLGITANAGGGQGSAVTLISSYHEISTCASAADSVKLPSAFQDGAIIEVWNNGAESANVFPASGDDLGQGSDTAEALPAGEGARYIATVSNSTWQKMLGGGAPVATSLVGANANGPSILDIDASSLIPNIIINKTDANTGIGSGAADSLAFICGGDPSMELTKASNETLVSHTVEGFITAFSGGGQGSAFALDSSYSNVTTVAAAGDSVRLPAVFKRGTVMVVANSDSTDAMDIFPASGDDLGAGTDTAVSVAAGGAAMFFATVANVSWRQIKG